LPWNLSFGFTFEFAALVGLHELFPDFRRDAQTLSRFGIVSDQGHQTMLLTGFTWHF